MYQSITSHQHESSSRLTVRQFVLATIEQLRYQSAFCILIAAVWLRKLTTRTSRIFCESTKTNHWNILAYQQYIYLMHKPPNVQHGWIWITERCIYAYVTVVDRKYHRTHCEHQQESSSSLTSHSPFSLRRRRLHESDLFYHSTPDLRQSQSSLHNPKVIAQLFRAPPTDEHAAKTLIQRTNIFSQWHNAQLFPISVQYITILL